MDFATRSWGGWVIARAVAWGTVMAALGTIPWALLGWANLTYWPAVPWSAPFVAAYLYFYWRWAGGEGRPASTAEERRVNRRTNPVDPGMWGMAMLAGMLGLASIVSLMRVLSRMTVIPAGERIDTSQASVFTLLYLILASAVVSGIVEEISYRGHLQRPIERRYGFFVALLVSGVMFGFAHFTHAGVGLPLIPYYLAVSAVYGALAWLTDSVYPSMLLHGFGNFFGSIGILAGRRDWAREVASPAPLIWESGADGSFWSSVVVLIVVGGVTVAAFAGLAAQRSGLRAARPA